MLLRLLNLTRNPSRFISISNDNKIKIYDIVKKIESREIRQKKLFKEYINNVSYDEQHKKISIKNLSKKYDIEEYEILISLFYHRLLSNNKHETKWFTNPFNLPEYRILAHKMYDVPRSNKLINVEDDLKNQYIKNIDQDKYNDIDRMCMHIDDFIRYIIFHKNGQYDYSQISMKYRSRINPEDHANPKSKIIMLVEKKDPERNYDSYVFRGIIQMSQRYEGNIKIVGNTPINQRFDGSDIYDISGSNDIEHAIINCLSYKLRYNNTDGNDSIVNEETIELINKMLDHVALNLSINDNDKKKLYNDLIDNTIHTNNDTCINIGKLMDLYNIEGYELFIGMFIVTEPCGYGYIEYNQKKNEIDNLKSGDDFKKILEEHDYYIDYVYGKPIKNSFRKKIGEEQHIRIKKYDYDNPGLFYSALFSLMRIKSVFNK